MRHGFQKKLAGEIGVEPSMIKKISNRKARPGWDTAKRLAEITGSGPEIWMELDLVEIEAVLETWSGNNSKN